jgi:hypothetical protein
MCLIYVHDGGFFFGVGSSGPGSPQGDHKKCYIRGMIFKRAFIFFLTRAPPLLFFRVPVSCIRAS